MILSHAHRFIFLKTRKTAGTSVEIALSKFCGPADVITRHTPDDQAIRAALGYPGPQHEYSLALRDYRSADWRRLLLRGRRARFQNHMRAARLRSIVGQRVWNAYYKFTVERDPWDKAVSLYFWRTRHARQRPPLLEFLQSAKPSSLSNFDIYAIDDALVVDRVIRYENLACELEEVRQALGLPGTLELPRAKGAHRPEASHYATLVGAQEKALIDRVCAREIALFHFGYVGR